ncbi:MAG: hypothetical protein A2Y41_06090 [Spirochaetes bacterium GWB1_36_13]|nr:MAG: hypothetical protein A2Y41_06090 [Spirochaetes bacterium GWB1_36_13]
MKILRESLILLLSIATFIYIVSIFTFTPGTGQNLLHASYPGGGSILGGFGNKIASFAFFMVGKGSYFLSIPLFLFIFALILQKKHWLKKMKWLFLFVPAMSGFYGLYSSETEMIQGGIIGNISGVLLKNLFGIVGTTLIVFIINAYLISKIFPELYEKLKSMTAGKRNDYFKHSEKKEESGETVEEKIKQEEEWKVFYNYKKNKEKPAEDLFCPKEYQVIPIHPEKKKEENLEKVFEAKETFREQAKEFYVEKELNTYPKENLVNPYHMEDFMSYPDGEEETEIEDEAFFKDVLNYEEESFEDFEEFEDDQDEEEEALIQEQRAPFKINFALPPMDILKNSPQNQNDNKEVIRNIGLKLLSILKEFSIDAKLGNILVGPVVISYEIIPPKGLKVNKILSLIDNMTMGIAALEKIRIEPHIPGKSVIRIEVPNPDRKIIAFRDLVESEAFHPEKMGIPFALGKGISGDAFYTDITKIPHLLIAGSTGSGKSVCVNSLICSVLYSKRPDEVRLILVDPKRVELKMYEDLPHLSAPVIKETSQAILVLKWAVSHMEERYKVLENYNTRNISNYNEIRERENKPKMPFLMIIIDEFADLMMIGGKEIEDPIVRLAAMARAVGIHLVLATQRPSADVITGLIKANFPGRIAFKVASKLESRIILDINGADSLLGKGDMLYSSPDLSNLKRLQSPFISDEEVFQITQFFKTRYKSNYSDDILEALEGGNSENVPTDPSEEPLFNEAAEIIVREKKASASYLQRRLKIGYNRAARIIEMMEEMGMIGPQHGSKPREVLIDSW